jgi:integrase
MRLKDYDDRDGKRVWLLDDELSALLDDASDTEQSIAFQLAGRVGLRRSEIVQIRPADLVDGPTGAHIRVWEDVAKRDKYREPPAPDDLATTIQAYSDVGGVDADEPLVDRRPKTVYRWVRRAAERRQAATNDAGWQFVGPHDLRRTWGTYLLEQGVLPSVVMEWGGWEDWETFREHYLGEFSPEAIKRERGKVDFLGGSPDGERPAQSSIVPAGSIHRSSG